MKQNLYITPGFHECRYIYVYTIKKYKIIEKSSRSTS